MEQLELPCATGASVNWTTHKYNVDQEKSDQRVFALRFHLD